jgi:predicted dehydrogenase
MTDPIGVAVIGAGMAGRAHAAAYRTATTVYDPVLPPVRLVSVGDLNPDLGQAAARSYGYERTDADWRTIADDPAIHVVSVVVANSLHREIVEGLLAAGKHVLCEKPLSNTLDDARAMAEAARAASGIARVGFTFRRSPGIAFIRDLIQDGTLGPVRHLSGRYWADYAATPDIPISWRHKGGPGSGALADVGSHLSYLAEFFAGDVVEVSGGRFATVIGERPKALGTVTRTGAVAVSDEVDTVENDDYAAFSAAFAGGASGGLEVSRVAKGHANTLVLEVFAENGSASFDFRRPAEVGLHLDSDAPGQGGFRQVFLGPDHPYLSRGLPMDATGVGFGQNEGFVFQARAFLEEVAGITGDGALPPCATFDEGVHNMELLAAVAQSAARNGAAVAVPAATGATERLVSA